MEAVRLKRDFAEILDYNSNITILTYNGHGIYIFASPFFVNYLIIISVFHPLDYLFYRSIFQFKMMCLFRK